MLKFLISYSDDSVHGSSLLDNSMKDADYFGGWAANDILKKFPDNFHEVKLPFDDDHMYYEATFESVEKMAEFLEYVSGTIVSNDFDSNHTEEYKYCIELFTF